MQSFQTDDIFQIPKFSARPKKKPPSAAPGMLPTPPIIDAVIPLRIAFIPIVGSIFVSREISIPAAPAITDPTKKEISMIQKEIAR